MDWGGGGGGGLTCVPLNVNLTVADFKYEVAIGPAVYLCPDSDLGVRATPSR